MNWQQHGKLSERFSVPPSSVLPRCSRTRRAAHCSRQPSSLSTQRTGRDTQQPATASTASPVVLSDAQDQNGLPFLHNNGNGRHKQLRVAVDVDEVLGRFVFALNQYCKEMHDMEYDIADYHIYEFAKIWGCTTDRSNHIVHEFFKSPHFNDGIPVIPGSFETLKRLQHYCDLVVVTSRQHIIQDVTMEWINNHFPGVFSDVHFGNHFALEGKSRKKSEICRDIGAAVLIDDNPQYAMDCATAGIDVLLYDWHLSYPWSKMSDGKMHQRIKIVRDWDEVERAVLSMVCAANR